MSSWRGFASTETALSLPWIIFNVWFCRDSHEASKGWIPQSAKLNRLLNWLFPCKWNIFGHKCLCKLHVSVSCGARHCFSVTPPLTGPTKFGLLRAEQKGCRGSRWEGGTMEKIQDGRLNHTSLVAGCVTWNSLPRALVQARRTSSEVETATFSLETCAFTWCLVSHSGEQSQILLLLCFGQAGCTGEIQGARCSVGIATWSCWCLWNGWRRVLTVGL